MYLTEDNELLNFKTSLQDRQKVISKKNMSFMNYIDEINRTIVEDILTHHKSPAVFNMIEQVINLETTRYDHLMYNIVRIEEIWQ